MIPAGRQGSPAESGGTERGEGGGSGGDSGRRRFAPLNVEAGFSRAPGGLCLVPHSRSNRDKFRAPLHESARLSPARVGTPALQMCHGRPDRKHRDRSRPCLSTGRMPVARLQGRDSFESRALYPVSRVPNGKHGFKIQNSEIRIPNPQPLTPSSALFTTGGSSRRARRG